MIIVNKYTVREAKTMESFQFFLQKISAKLIKNLVLVWNVTVDPKYAKIMTFQALD